MALISPADQERLREDLSVMTRPVRLLFFTQALDCETCLLARQILDELPALSDKIAVEEVNFVLEVEKAAKYGIDRVPAIAVVSQDDAGAERDSNMRFLGTPSGYEFISLIHAIRLVGGAAVASLRRRPCARRGRRSADDDACVHDADLSALSAGRQSGARDGMGESEHHGVCRRSHRVSRISRGATTSPAFPRPSSTRRLKFLAPFPRKSSSVSR